jgi:hypothetical protein
MPPDVQSRLGMPFARVAFTAMLACAASSATGQNPVSPSGATRAGWPSYTNSQYGFAVSYPADYGIVPESTPPESGAAFRVRFQVKALLTSEFVDREPARFMVEVFVLPQPISLAAWLGSKNRLPADAVSSAITMQGAQEGRRVQRSQQLAPNDFYYFTRGNNVFALTPLGPQSAAMLASFHFI